MKTLALPPLAAVHFSASTTANPIPEAKRQIAGYDYRHFCKLD